MKPLQSAESGESSPPLQGVASGTAEGAGNSRTLRQKDWQTPVFIRASPCWREMLHRQHPPKEQAPDVE